MAKVTEFKKNPWIEEHIALYKSDPEAAHMWDSSPHGGPGILPTLLLTTRGRKSGEPRSQPLIYGTHGESYTIIASKGGARAHPLWYMNLEATPACELMVGAKAITARARVAEGSERKEIWDKMVELFPIYLKYQEATDRTIPVVVLDPV